MTLDPDVAATVTHLGMRGFSYVSFPFADVAAVMQLVPDHNDPHECQPSPDPTPASSPGAAAISTARVSVPAGLPAARPQSAPATGLDLGNDLRPQDRLRIDSPLLDEVRRVVGQQRLRSRRHATA